jgi:hypothetical protein
MPVMNRKCGKAQRIFEDIMGTPPNQHKALKRDPRISEMDIQRTILALGLSGGGQNMLMDSQNGGNDMMPQNNGSM